MSLGLIGKKCGMTRLFMKNGSSIPITVINIKKNYITQIKTIISDGYNAFQLSSIIKKNSNVNKCEKGHFLKIKIKPCKYIKEFKVSSCQINKFKNFKEFDISILDKYKFVTISGISKGKGFQGVVKRHNFKMQDATHGNSLSHRVHGSTGQNQTPGRVFKNKKMAGHMGNSKNTIKKLKILNIDKKNELLLIKGSVPGFNGSILFISIFE